MSGKGRPKNKNLGTGGINEVITSSSTTTASSEPMEVVVQSAVATQESNDIQSGASRSFGLYDSSESEPTNIFGNILKNIDPSLTTDISPERGTPQKRLHDLMVACKNIVDSSKGTIPFSKSIINFSEKCEQCINELKVISREDILKDGRGGFIEEYINLFFADLKKSKDKNLKNQIVMLLWSIIVVKSISDISQCGSFVNDIPKIIQQVGNLTVRNSQSVVDSGAMLVVGDSNIIASSSSNTTSSLSRDPCEEVNNIMKDNLNMCFVSSDGSCAAFSTNVLRLINYPIPILHSRKTGKTTQAMILQKSKVSVLSVILSLANENTYEGPISEFIKNILNNTQHLSEGIHASINVFSKIYRLTRKYYVNLIINYQEQSREYSPPSLNELLEKEIDEMFANPDEYNIDRKNLLCNLIVEISKIDTPDSKILEKSLDEISTVLSFGDKDINVPRWAYHISNDVFKYMYPLSFYNDSLSNIRFNQSRNLKQEISLQEILSATADAMYCHDFELECLYTLGKSFLESIGQENLYQDIKIFDDDKQKNKSYDVIEKECIAETLALNSYSTLNQHDDYFEICFNPLYNFIKRDKNEAGYRNAQVPWNIGFSPFITTPLVAAIDFTVGEATFSWAFVGQINQINKMRNVKYLLPFASIDNRADLEQYINDLKQYTKLFEYCGVTTLYDGAAPYGAFPLVCAQPPYETVINTTVGQYKITTQTTKSNHQVSSEWVESKFTLTNLELLKNYIVDLPQESKERFYKSASNNKENDPYYFFNLIWGTILNSNPKLPNTYKGVISSEYNRIITDVLNKIERLKQNNSLGRPQREKASIYATGSNDFDDYTQFISLKDELQYVKETIKHSDDKFQGIMNIYIQYVLGSDSFSVEQKNTLLKILELAVFNKSNESIDADMFVGLNSNILQQYSKRELNEAQQGLVDKLRSRIKRINELNNMAINFKKNQDDRRGKSIHSIELSKTPEQPTKVVKPKSAQARVEYTDVYNELSNIQGTKLELDSQPPNETNGLDSEDSLQIKKSDDEPQQSNKVSRPFVDVARSNESESLGEHIRNVARGSDSQTNSDDETVMSQGSNEGGSRKHHIQSHKTVTRRKTTTKSSKRKTIKKRKMQKRNTKTRRNK